MSKIFIIILSILGIRNIQAKTQFQGKRNIKTVNSIKSGKTGGGGNIGPKIEK